MATDRGAILTIRAAARGLLSRRFKPRDVMWWRRSTILIREMAQESEREVLAAAYDFQLALMTNTQLDFDKASKAAQDGFHTLQSQHQPWAAKNAEDRQNEEIGKLLNDYIETIGDFRDPAFMKQLEEGIAKSRENRQKRRTVSEEDLLDQRIAAYDQQRRQSSTPINRRSSPRRT